MREKPPIFLKWAGGKRLLSKRICDTIARKSPKRYIEPFLGGGAVFFDLKPDRAILSDLNSDLIDTYTQIRDNTEAVRHKLYRCFLAHTEDFYYDMRELFNTEGAIHLKSDRAAAFIYLNRACFNGLWRTNSKGEMNSPVGDDNRINFDLAVLDDASRALDRTDIIAQDFERTIAEARSGDCIYCDPPYYPINSSGFVGYSKNGFTDGDRIRLAKSLHKAASRGANFILSDTDCHFTRDLYNWNDRLEILTLDRVNRAINPTSKVRNVSELLIFTV